MAEKRKCLHCGQNFYVWWSDNKNALCPVCNTFQPVGIIRTILWTARGMPKLSGFNAKIPK